MGKVESRHVLGLGKEVSRLVLSLVTSWPEASPTQAAV